ncbi:hypothetical protein FP2506_16024 [Fulvimarina pelagi HTCC2506]|uniref:Uncharacterized protein n=1 Tax=Fulvimarina pelagi HTCC2506 TaxID=314231 RepID=Q0G375_9HYPH|nr:hypothetical protein FP2506_16024 [Fulvimarina pelagi HTCC2506]
MLWREVAFWLAIPVLVALSYTFVQLVFSLNPWVDSIFRTLALIARF